MLKNYFKIALRSLLKNKVYSIVNILGLAIGMTSCFFIFQYVHFESGYDRFNKNADRIFRVGISYSGDLSNHSISAYNHPALGPAMKKDFPEIKEFARVVPASVFMTGGSMVSYIDPKGNNRTFSEEKIFMADNSFLTMFSFPFLWGDPRKALSDPISMVISKTSALKYFGNDNPVGKTLYINGKPFRVSGVFKDVPENSHIKFDMLVSFLSLDQNLIDGNWTWPEFYNYVLLIPGATPKNISIKLPAFANMYMGEIMKAYNFNCQFYLQPITQIHLNSDYISEPEPHGSKNAVQLLSLIGVFILLIVWINYTNLSTAKSLERAKEVGLRKVIGASRKQLLKQFIFESSIINVLALFLSVIIVITSYPLLSLFYGPGLSNGLLTEAIWNTVGFWLAVVLIFISGILVVGAYPAFILSSFKPILALKGNFQQTYKGISTKKVLVSFQFILSMILIAGTITVYKQLSYMRNIALGYDKDQIVVIKAPVVHDSTLGGRINTFKTELLKNPDVNKITMSSDIPGKLILATNDAWKASQDEKTGVGIYEMEIDENYIPALQINLIAGRNFYKADNTSIFQTRINKVIINEMLAHELGFVKTQDALQQYVFFRTNGLPAMAEIIGIINNYHQRSLREHYDPILYYYPTWNKWKYFSAKVNPKNMEKALANIESLYKSTFPGNAFEYFFLNDYYKQQFVADEKFGKIFTLFTAIAIFISSLGLLGLYSYTIKLRTKEIGIRKVVGASVMDIMYLFFIDFLKLISLAFLIAMPVSFIASKNWLDTYAFHIDLNWLIFLIPPLVLLIISMLTISLQSVKVALANPVKSLRSE
jgi:putative ABC transport system permease protein